MMIHKILLILLGLVLTAGIGYYLYLLKTVGPEMMELLNPLGRKNLEFIPLANTRCLDGSTSGIYF
jgi:hypothetical protein